jgi:hypothetical protein
VVLSIRSDTFQDALKDYQQLQSEGKLATKKEQELFFKSKGTNLDEFRESAEEYNKALDAGETDFRARTTMVGRTAGRLVGDVLSGIASFTDAFTPGELEEYFSDSLKDSNLPRSFVNFMDEALDPYHGEGIIAGGENLVGTIGSYIVPGNAIIKSLGLAGKGSKLLSNTSRTTIAREARKLEKKKRKDFLNEEINKALPKGRLMQAGQQGGIYAGVATVVEEPAENIVNVLTEMAPESTEFMARLAANPEDTEAEQYLKSLIANLGLASLFSPLAIASAYRKPLSEGTSAAFKPLEQATKSIKEGISPHVPAWFKANLTSRGGLDDTGLAIKLERENAVDAANAIINGSLNTYDNTIKNYAKEQAKKTNRSVFEIEDDLKENINVLFKQDEEVFNSYLDKFNTINTKTGVSNYDKVYKTELNKILSKSDANKKIKRLEEALPKAKGKKAVSISNQINKLSKSITQAEDKARQLADKKAIDYATVNQKRKIKTGINKFPTDVRQVVVDMRNDIDNLSKDYMKGLKDEDAASLVDSRLGLHLVRSYRFYDDPNFKKDVINKFKEFEADPTKDTEGVFSSALDTLTKNIEPDKELVASIGEEAAKNQKGMEALRQIINKSDNTADVTNILRNIASKGEVVSKQKAGLSSANSAILGREDDFTKNYAKTLVGLSRVNAEQKAINELRDHIEVSGLALSKATDGAVNIGDIAKQRLNNVYGKGAVDEGLKVENALEDIYVTPEYAEAFGKGFNELTDEGGFFFKTFAKLKGLSQAAKTIWSPVTHGRNVGGNAFFMLANGFGGPSDYKQSADLMLKNLRGKTTREQGELLARLKKYGVIGQNVEVNVIKNNLRGFSKNPEGYVNDIIERTRVLKPVQKLHEKLQDVYQAEDDVFKITHFMKTLNQLRKSPTYKNLSEEELEKVAAQYTRDLLPNYALVPTALKGLRRGLLGDFLSFPAEVTRVSKNLAMYSIKDIASGDPVLAAMGAKRLAGMTAVGTFGDVMSDLSRQTAGITDEQEQAINNTFVPEWEFNTDRIYLSPLKTDANGHKTIEYMNLGYIDPFSYIKQMAKGANSLVMAGVFDKDIGNKNLSSIALGTLENALSPFVAPSMLTDGLINIYNGVEGGEGVETALASVYDVFEPGLLTFVKKRMEYDRAKEQADEQGGLPMKKGYFTYSEGEVDFPAAFGLKRQTLDLTAATRFKLNPLLNQLKNSNRNFNKYLTDPSITNPEDISNEYIKQQEKHLEGMQDLRNVILDFQDMFGKENFTSELYNGLTLDGVLPTTKTDDYNIYAATRNQFTPFDFKPTAQIETIAKPPINYDVLRNINSQLYGTQLLED